MTEKELKSLISWAADRGIKTVDDLISYSRLCDYQLPKMTAVSAAISGTKKHYRKADYSHVKRFGGECVFESGCVFGDSTSFENDCAFGNGCVFGKECRFFGDNTFGDKCVFGRMCLFVEKNVFGKECIFELSTFMGRNVFGVSCRFLKHNCFDEACEFGSLCVFDACGFAKPCKFGAFSAFSPLCAIDSRSEIGAHSALCVDSLYKGGDKE